VVRVKVTRERAKSMKKNSKSAEEWLSPDRLPISVKNSTKTQKAIWEVIKKRVRGVKERRKVNIFKKVFEVIRLPAVQLVHEIEAIATGLTRATTIEDILLVYTQCLLDAFRTQIFSQKI
jgi:hypothetical protein